MIISSAIRWCWLAYLLLAAWAVLAMANPVSQRPRHICGTELRVALDKACLIYRSYFPLYPSSDTVDVGNDLRQRAESERGSLTDECCVKGCTQEYLFSFCEVIRNQTKEVQPSSQELGVAYVTDGAFQPDLETFAPTDPPYQPEIRYDVEYSDQEPLTLLPTYTSPEYTNDLLLLQL